eukprot:scaffold572723_cov24-Prasinocladus_malaysianus.AAC.1
MPCSVKRRSKLKSAPWFKFQVQIARQTLARLLMCSYLSVLYLARLGRGTSRTPECGRDDPETRNLSSSIGVDNT